MVRKLVFRIWILFGIWALGFGKLETFWKGKSLLSELALAGFDLTLIFPALATNTSKDNATCSMDTAEDNNTGIYLCSPTTGKFRGFLI